MKCLYTTHNIAKKKTKKNIGDICHYCRLCMEGAWKAGFKVRENNQWHHWLFTWHFMLSHMKNTISFSVTKRSELCAFYLYYFIFNTPICQKMYESVFYLCVCEMVGAEGFFLILNPPLYYSHVAIKCCSVRYYCDFRNLQFYFMKLWLLLWMLAERQKKHTKKESKRQSCATVHILFRNVKDNSFCSKSEKRNIYFSKNKTKYDLWKLKVSINTQWKNK